MNVGLQAQSKIENDPSLAALGGTLYLDLNENGKQDSDEPGMNSASITLINLKTTELASLKTDKQGKYEFRNLSPASYQLQFNCPTGVRPGQLATQNEHIRLADDRCETLPIELSAGDYHYNIKLGFMAAPVSMLEGTLWNDSNRNGIQDPGEAGLTRLQVHLYNDAGDLVQEQLTDQNGRYRFAGMKEGTYQLDFPWNVDYTLNKKKRARDFGIDFSSNGNKSEPIKVKQGKKSLDYSVGLYMQGASGVKGRIFKDDNANGLIDTDEQGLKNVRVSLFTMKNEFINYKNSDSDGCYSFDDLMPGRYYLEVSAPDSYSLTESAGLTMGRASKFLEASHQTRVLLLNSDEVLETVHAGFVAAAAIPGNVHGQVWNDLDRDAQKETGEDPVNGMQVQLLGDHDFNMVALTDATGSFTFNNVPAGNYVIRLGSYARSFSSSTAQQLLLTLESGAKSYGNDFGINIDMDQACPQPEVVCADPYAQTKYCLSDDFVPKNYKLKSVDGMYAGKLAIDGDRCISYTPATGMINESELVYLSFCRGGGTDCVEQCLEFFVGQCLTKPVANDDKLTLNCGEKAIVEVLQNDTRPETGQFFISDHTQPSKGDINKLDNAFQYVAAEEFSGVDFFTYTLSDGAGGLDQATVIVEIEDCAFAPVANIDAVKVDCNGSQSFNPLANDFDRNRDRLEICALADPENGTISRSGNQLTYIAKEGFNGFEIIDYSVCDPTGRKASSKIKIEVGYCNEAPLTENDFASLACDQIRVQVLKNDIDPDGDALSICDFQLQGPGELALEDKAFSYHAPKGYSGKVSVVYYVCDGNGGRSAATLDLSVDCPLNAKQDQMIVAKEDQFVGTVNAALPLPVLNNDSFTPLAKVEICDFSEPEHGMLLLEDNRLTYIPEQGFTGEDSFTYLLCSKSGQQSSAEVLLLVNPAAPCQDELDFCTAIDQAISLCVEVCSLGNIQTITRYDSKQKAMISNRNQSCFIYNPPEGFEGTDDLELTACNEMGECSSVIAKIVVGDCSPLPEKLEQSNSAISENPYEQMFIPDGFSPNGDGVNDFFLVEDLLKLSPSSATLEVFDENGQQVYMDTAFQNSSEGWNGEDYRNNARLASGTYFYVLRIESDGLSTLRKGALLLKY